MYPTKHQYYLMNKIRVSFSKQVIGFFFIVNKNKCTFSCLSRLFFCPLFLFKILVFFWDARCTENDSGEWERRCSKNRATPRKKGCTLPRHLRSRLRMRPNIESYFDLSPNTVRKPWAVVYQESRLHDFTMIFQLNE